MKIAMVSPYSWAHAGGVNNHILGLSAEMVRRGHAVTVIAPDHGEPEGGASFLSAGRSVPVRANGSVARLVLSPAAARRTGDAIRRGAFDVVHVHEPMLPPVSTAAVLAAPNRAVGTFHAAGDRSLIHRASGVLFRGVGARLDARVAVSDSAKELAGAYTPGEYQLVPNGVDLVRFSPGKPRPPIFPGEAPTVLFVGRNEPRKGFDLLLRSLPEVLRGCPGCHIVVVGTGFDKAKVASTLERSVKQKGNGPLPGAAEIMDRIRFAGFVPNDELPAYYAAADIFCAPSLGGESFGIVLLEANACGTPVVCSDIAGYSAVLNATGGGVLFRNGDPADLAQRLIDLLADRKRLLRLGEAGFNGVQEFSWGRIADRIERVYLGGRPA